MDFQLGKTAAVYIEIIPDRVSQDEKKACQKPANGRKASTNFKQKAESSQKFNGRKAYCRRNEQFFGKQAVCGNSAGKGTWVNKLGAAGYKKNAAEQDAHKTAEPWGIKKRCPKKCQGRLQIIRNFRISRLEDEKRNHKKSTYNTELRSNWVLREGIKPSPTEEPSHNVVGAGFIPAQS
jgi:hypothetical protein